VTGVQATQATAEARPTQSATALNNRPGLTFDGGDWLRTAAFAAVLAQPYSVVMAVQLSSAAGTGGIVFEGIASSNRGLLGHFTVTSVRRMTGYHGRPTTYTTSALPTDTPVTYRGVINGASGALALNGVEQAFDVGSATLNGITIGAGLDNADPWLGVIADILIFSGTDYAARAARADALMRAYYGI
jgi:hypothetical protein